MSELRGIDADFTSFRHVQGRKVIQLTFEVPIERTAEVFNMLGSPRSGESLWCAIAPLNLKARTEGQASNASGSPKKFVEMPLSQQAALRCGDVLFQECHGAESAEIMADILRRECGVSSRADLDDKRNVDARNQFADMEAAYQGWLTDRKYAQVAR